MVKVFGKRALSLMVASVILIGNLISVLIFTSQADENQQQELKSYNAVQIITEAQISPQHLYTDNIFSYSEKSLVLDSVNGKYLPTGKFKAVTLNLYAPNSWCSMDGNIRNHLYNMLFKWDAGTGEGFAVKDNQLVTYVGKNTNHAPALTFTANANGTVRLWDPAGGDIAPAQPDSLLSALDKDGESIGVAVYKNNQKLWPDDNDYYELNYTNKAVAFPDIKDIPVKEGDKLYVMFIPLNIDYGYMSFAAQVDYTSMGAALPSYSAAGVVDEAQNTGAFSSGSAWTYTTKALKFDSQSGMYLPSGKWNTPELKNTDSSDESINNTLVNQMLIEGTNAGLASLNGKIYTFVGYAQSNSNMGAVTFTAPYTGTIEINDPLDIGIGTAGKEHPFWTMHDKGLKVGIAVYHNNDKIWPTDSDFEVLTGDKWSAGVQTEGKTNIEFPDLGALTVTRGDKIRIALIPLTQDWGYITLSPRADYTYVDEFQPDIPLELPSYSSVEAVKKAQENEKFSEFSEWKYTIKKLKINDESGYYLPYTDWYYPELVPGKSDSDGVNSLLTNQLNIAGSNMGVATYNNKVHTFTGYSSGNAGALTFVAPYSGKLEFSDINNVGIGTAGKAHPFWTMHENATKVGVAIYHNEEKIWPADSDYYELVGDKWDNGQPTYGNTTIPLPDLGTLTVEKGDEIKFAIIPLSLHWGYFALAPQANYVEIDAVQPEEQEVKSYTAKNDVASAIQNGTFEGTNWMLEGSPCYPNLDNINVPVYEWSVLNPIAGTTADKSISDAIPNWLTDSRGEIATYGNGVILKTGNSGVDFAISLTFEAPKTGVVDIKDTTGSAFGSAGIGAPFWTLNESFKIAGLAIYKNDEKLWPLDSDYFTLQGQWDASIGGYNYDNVYQILFPTLKDIQVNAGDKLRICVIPVKNIWHYITLSPTVEYETYDEESQKPSSGNISSVIKSYSAVDSFKESGETESMEKSLWKLEAIESIWSELVDAPINLGILVNNDLPILYKRYMMGDTLFPNMWFNVSETSVYAQSSDNRIVMNTSGSSIRGLGVYPALSFTAPQTGVVRLHTLAESPGFSAMSSWYPYWTLMSTYDPDAGENIQFVIYRNNEKIYPLSKNDSNTVTQYQRTIPFPDMEMQVYKGDTIRIVVAGTSGWSFASLSPVVDYLSYNQKNRPSDDNPEWSYGDKSLYEFTWEDFDTPDDYEDSDNYENSDNNENFDNSELIIESDIQETVGEEEELTQETVKKKQQVKKIIKRRYKKNEKSSVNLISLVIIVVAAVIVITFGLSLFIIIRKKRKLKR